MTWGCKRTYIIWKISTHTLTWSVTQRCNFKNFLLLFQLTRSRGAWPAWYVTQIQELHFNSHAHVERDAISWLFKNHSTDFNSHAHVERDMELARSQRTNGHFNSHAHVERDKWNTDIGKVRNNFNSHAHVERDSDFPRLAEWIEHFNSHAHVERDRLNQLKKSGYYISTHTLTWSVTQKT